MPALRQIMHEMKATLALAAPIVAGQLSQMLMGVADSVMVGRVGVTPLAASAFANSLLAVPFLFGIGLLQCISVRVAEAHGGGERAEAGELLRHGLALSMVLGMALAGLTALISGHLGGFGQAPEVAESAGAFFLLIGVSLLPMFMAMSLRQFSEALGHPWPPMTIMFGGFFLNVALNWVLIYGHAGAPALGLAGAGWATLLSRLAVLLVLGAYVLWAQRFAGFRPLKWLQPLHQARIRSLLAIGLPAAGQLLLEVSAFSAAAIMVGWLGAAPLAAHQIALTCAATAFMFPLGVAMAATIRVGQAVGAREQPRLRAIGIGALLLSLLCTGFGALVLASAAGPIARCFVTDPVVVAIAVRLLLVAALFQLFDGLQVVAAGALRGLSDTRAPLLICLLAYWLVATPLGWIAAFPLGFGAVGVWASLAVALAVAAALLVWRFWCRSGALLPR